MTNTEQQDIKLYLNCLYTDFSMLVDGSWDGDADAADASLSVLCKLAKILVGAGVLPEGYTPTDDRITIDCYDENYPTYIAMPHPMEDEYGRDIRGLR